MRVAFNNWGFHSGVPEMAPYIRDGVAGYIRAAHDLGFKAYQLQTGSEGLLASAPSFQEVDVVGIREKLQHIMIDTEAFTSPFACAGGIDMIG